MHIESYTVEIQSLTTDNWTEEASFKPTYKWGERNRFGLFNLFGFLRRTRPVIEGSATVQAMTAKADALQKARKTQRARKPRSVRIVRVWRDGTRISRVVIWHNGTWLE